jgi:hypothetical protein
MMKNEQVYEMWYEFLKRTDPNDWSVAVKRDFMGVMEQDFEEWFFDAYFKIFSPAALGVAPVRQYSDPGDIRFNSKTDMIIVVDLSRPKDRLMKSIDFLLDLKQPLRKLGRAKFHQLPAKYMFAKRPDIEALKIVLDVHDAKRDHPDWTLWEVGSYLQKLHPILLKQKLNKTDTVAVRTAKQKVLTATFGRYLARAEKIKAGVVKGVFPAA